MISFIKNVLVEIRVTYVWRCLTHLKYVLDSFGLFNGIGKLGDANLLLVARWWWKFGSESNSLCKTIMGVTCLKVSKLRELTSEMGFFDGPY